MRTPTATAARFPAEYGQTRESLGELQPWDEVAARIAAARNYFVATTTPEGRPHVRPVDGTFVEGVLCFGGSPQTRWVRHVQERPEVSICLPDDDQAVILEGRVELITDPESLVWKALAPAQAAKYPQYFRSDEPPQFLPFWALAPRRVYAWSLTGFPARATRFDF
jgi:general stress protein 26